MVKLQNPRYVFIFQFTAHLPNSLFMVTLLLTLVNYRLFLFVMSFALSFRLSTIFALPDYLLMHVPCVHNILECFLLVD